MLAYYPLILTDTNDIYLKDQSKLRLFGDLSR